MILGLDNITFNRFQILHAEMHYRFNHKSYEIRYKSLSEINNKKSFELVNRDHQQSFKKYLRRLYKND